MPREGKCTVLFLEAMRNLGAAIALSTRIIRLQDTHGTCKWGRRWPHHRNFEVHCGPEILLCYTLLVFDDTVSLELETGVDDICID
jgi:hypothetical protein